MQKRGKGISGKNIFQHRQGPRFRLKNGNLEKGPEAKKNLPEGKKERGTFPKGGRLSLKGQGGNQPEIRKKKEARQVVPLSSDNAEKLAREKNWHQIGGPVRALNGER